MKYLHNNNSISGSDHNTASAKRVGFRNRYGVREPGSLDSSCQKASVPRFSKWLKGAASVTMPLLACSAVHAAGLSSLSGIADNDHLFGDWGGERSKLEAKGLQFDFTFSDEISHNFTGGNQHLTRAASQLAVNVTADLDKLWGIHHTKFFLVVSDRFGRSVDADADIGSKMQSQEIYGRGQTVWLTKLTLDRTFFDGRLELSAGRDSEGANYDLAGCDFQSLALCGPQGPNLYGSYWMSYPGSVWMANAMWHTTTDTFIQFGVFQQNPTYYDASWERRNAWKPISPGGNTGVVLPLEFGWTPKLLGKEGQYRVGAMLNTGGMPNLTLDKNGNQRAVTGVTAAQSGESYNVWIAASQRLTGENGGEGLTAGFRGVIGDRATSAMDRQMTATFEYQNPFHRAGDRIGLGFAATHVSSRQAEYQEVYNQLHPEDASKVGNGYEYTSEIYYEWQAMKSVSFQPSLQYLIHPGGTAQNPNAFFIGLRSTIDF